MKFIPIIPCANFQQCNSCYEFTWEWWECTQCGMRLCIRCDDKNYNCHCNADWVHGESR